MVPVHVSGPARQDVRAILSDLNESAGHDVAARFAQAFKAAYRDIADFPGSGPPRPALGPDARIKIVYPYVIVYDTADNAATVLRVLHGRRDITAALIRR